MAEITKRQVELVTELQDRGAPIPETDHGNPDNSMFESFEGASAYIKEHGHLMQKHSNKLRADEWGGVLNH